MVDREIIDEWLTKADDDFEFARINLNEATNALHSAENIRNFILKKLA
jgi:hypothetical protein